MPNGKRAMNYFAVRVCYAINIPTYYQDHFSFVTAIAFVRMTVQLSPLKAIKPFKNRKEWFG